MHCVQEEDVKKPRLELNNDPHTSFLVQQQGKLSGTAERLPRKNPTKHLGLCSGL